MEKLLWVLPFRRRERWKEDGQAAPTGDMEETEKRRDGSGLQLSLLIASKPRQGKQERQRSPTGRDAERLANSLQSSLSSLSAKDR